MEKTIELADDVIKAAQDATGLTGEREAVERAVRGFAQSQRLKTPLEGMLELAGSALHDPNYDYKAMRATRNADDH